MLNFLQPKNILEDPIYQLSLEPFRLEMMKILNYFHCDDTQISYAFNVLKNNLNDNHFLEQLYLPQLNYYINELNKIIDSNEIQSEEELEQICHKIISYCMIPCAKHQLEISCKIVSNMLEIIDNDQILLESKKEAAMYTMSSEQGNILFWKDDLLLKKLAFSENPYLYYFDNKLLVKNSYINEVDSTSIEFLQENIEKYILKLKRVTSVSDEKEEMPIETVFYYRKAFKLIKDIWPEYYIEMKGTTRFLNILPYNDVQSHTNNLLPKTIFLPHIENDSMLVSELMIKQSSFLRLQHLTAYDELLENGMDVVFSIHHGERVHIHKIFFETFAAMRVTMWLDKLYTIYPSGDVYHRLDLVSYELSTNMNFLKKNASFTVLGRELWLELITAINEFLENRVRSNLLYTTN